MNDQDKGRLIAVLYRIIEITLELKEEKPVEEITLGERDQAVEQAMATLTELTSLRKELKQLLEQLMGEQVNRARHLGLSWAKIGEALGITSTGAYKKAQANDWITNEPPQ